jgi:hypothetical protein
MNSLTKQERRVIAVIVGLLLTGMAVKSYRAAHPLKAGEVRPPASVVMQPART